MNDGGLSTPEVQILVAAVKEAPETGYVRAEWLNNGIAGVESVNLHNSCRKLVERGLLSLNTSGDYQITTKGWDWIAANQDVVKAAQEVEQPSIILSKLTWWNRPLDEPMHGGLRFLFAGVGSSVWVGAQMIDPFALVTVEMFSGEVLPVAVLAIIICLTCGAWFGTLIAYQERRCSPSRFFIEGLLFPALAGILISESPIRAVLGG